MKKNCTFLIVLVFCLLQNAVAQFSRKNVKSSVPYRGGNYQRVAEINSQITYEIRNGKLFGWGANVIGQLGDGSFTDVAAPKQIGTDEDWLMVTTSSTSSNFGIQSDGSLWAWGSNSSGQLGDGTTTNKTVPTRIGNDTTWVAVSASPVSDFVLALKANGTLWAWGDNSLGQLGLGNTTSVSIPTQVGTDSNWASVQCGGFYSTALKANGTLWAWGSNASGNFGNGTTTNSNVPIQIGTDDNWVKLDAGRAFTVGLKANGTLWAWGINDEGQLGIGSTISQNTPTRIGTDSTWVSFSVSEKNVGAIKSNGTLWVWGQNTYSQLGDGTTVRKTIPTQLGTATNWVSISFSSRYAIAHQANGSLWAWGSNSNGNLGDGTTINRTTPVQIRTAPNEWVRIAVAGYVSFGLKADGTIWGWGLNQYGSLGNGTTTSSSTPLQIGTDNNWISISAVGYHVLALKANGTLWAWGFNNNGQVGIGSSGTNVLTPTQIGNDSSWASVFTGGENSMALKTNGTLWAWGRNSDGQLGNNSTTNSSTPIQIGTATNWVQASISSYNACALAANGSLWAWGANNIGQLGNGTTTSSIDPLRVGTENNWIACYMLEALTSVALKANGTIWVCGSNQNGQLGNNSNTRSTSFIQVGNNRNWVQVYGNSSNCTALSSNGSLWAWGGNANGQMGLGNTTNQLVPIQIANGVVQFSGTNYFTPPTTLGYTTALRKQICMAGNNSFGSFGNGTTTSSPTFNCNGSVLPIKLNYFIAKSENKNVLLQWGSSLEINSKEFVIERSIDGKKFDKLATVEAIGIASDYHFIDNNLPKVNVIYYRLRMVDKDGSFAFSEVRLLNFKSENTNLLVYPNPVKGSKLNVDFGEEIKAKTNYIITTVEGRVVQQGVINNQQETISIQNLSKGMYIIKLASKQKQFVVL
jgi:alpha-tubulin suppressor-like RCC1 family protein